MGIPVRRTDGQVVAAVVLVANSSRLSGPRRVVLAARMQRLSDELMIEPIKNGEEGQAATGRQE